MDPMIEDYDLDQVKENIPDFDIGDTVRISTKIIEGEKERVQVFQGTVIARKGKGLSETFSIHRVSYGEGMERVFYLHSPRIVNIEVIKKGAVRRSKLYYLRGKTGKQAKIREKIGGGKRSAKESESEEQQPANNDNELAASASGTGNMESSSQE